MTVETVLHELTTRPLLRFENLSDIPDGPGLYSAWLDDDSRQCFYVGIAPKVLKKRIRAHFSGGRGGDQFCLYVYDTCIFPVRTPGLTTKEVNGLTRQWIRSHVRFRVVEWHVDRKELLRLETELRRSMKPTLNPV